MLSDKRVDSKQEQYLTQIMTKKFEVTCLISHKRTNTIYCYFSHLIGANFV